MVTRPVPVRDGRRGSAPDAATLAVARAIGVTRIARVGELDRAGVEVAAAIRPDGHVLQVSNGKGGAFAEAAAGAVAEAAELWAAERPVVDAWGSAREVLDARRIAVEPLGDRDDPARRAWTLGRDLGSGDPVLVPAGAVSCGPAGSPLLGGAPVPWTSNGMGAHADRARALLHGLLEAIERDALARALPDGFTEREVRARLLDPATVAAASPPTAARVRDLEARGFRVHLLDVSWGVERDRAGDEGLPAAAALLVDDAHAPVPLAAGYACRLSPGDALHAALLEAAQSRVTEIHGAREDVLHGDRGAAAALAEWCAAARPRRDARTMPSARAPSPAAGVRAALARLSAAGFRRAVAVDLPSPPGLAVVRAIVPGLLLSELL